jgi:hypothetical protein
MSRAERQAHSRGTMTRDREKTMASATSAPNGPLVELFQTCRRAFDLLPHDAKLQLTQQVLHGLARAWESGPPLTSRPPEDAKEGVPLLEWLAWLKQSERVKQEAVELDCDFRTTVAYLYIQTCAEYFECFPGWSWPERDSGDV